MFIHSHHLAAFDSINHLNIGVCVYSFSMRISHQHAGELVLIKCFGESVYIHSHQHAAERMFGLEENVRLGSGGKLPFVLFMFSF